MGGPGRWPRLPSRWNTVLPAATASDRGGPRPLLQAPHPVTGASEVGTSRPKDEQTSPLSEIIRTINERFGTDWRPEDRLLFEQVVEDLMGDDGLAEQARANDLENFRHVFDPKALDAFIARMERNSGLASQILNNGELLAAVLATMMREVYRRARRPG